MAKKLLSEAQVRKFMGLANLDANLSSNFLKEMYGKPAKRDEEEMEEGMYKMKRDEDEMEEGMNLGDKHKGSKDKEPKGEDPHKKAREMDEGMYMKRDDEMDEEMGVAELEGGEPEEADEPEMGMDAADVELDEDEVAEAQSAIEKVQAVLSKLMGGAEPEPEMEPADEPEMEMDDEPEMMEDVNLQLSEDEIVQEVARRVAKRINEAARAQKKADKLLGRNKK